MIREDVIKRTWETLEGPIQQHGYALIEVEFGGAGGRQVLRLFIDRENGIGLDDCQTVSRLVDPILDAEDFIDGNYVLEVSSPGSTGHCAGRRTLKRFIGEPVVVKTHMPVNGRKRIKGLLTAFDSGMVAIACEDACTMSIWKTSESES